MSTSQENPTILTNSDRPIEDDLMSESGSTLSLASSSHLPPRIQKLVARLASLEEEMVRTDLAEEDIIKIQNSYAVYSKSLDMIMGVQKKLLKKEKVVIPTTSSKQIVPTDLPMLQWTGNVHDNSKTVFASIHECLDRFEDIIESYGQDINTHWCRLLPRMLSPDQRSWFIDNLKPHALLDWSFARKTLVDKYGIQDADRQAQFMQELFSLHMGRNDSVEQYTDRFHKLRREAGCEDNRVMAALYIKSLLPELSQHVTLSQAHLSADKRATIDHAANLARRLYGNVVHSKYSKQVASGSDSSTPTSASFASGPSSSPSFKKNKGKKGENKYCRVHGKGRHSSEECRALHNLQTSDNAGKVVKSSGSSGSRSAGLPSNSSSSSSSSSNKKCFRCGFVPWSKSHVCEVNHLAIRSASLSHSSSSVSGSAPVTPSSSSPAPTLDAGSNNSVHPDLAAVSAVSSTPSSSASPPATEDVLMSEVDESLSKACFNCKSNHSHDFTKHLFKNTKSYYVPITLEGREIFAFVDPGSTFTAITPGLRSSLGLPYTACPGKIGMAAPGFSVDRIGHTNKTKIIHNGLTAFHNFEIMNLNSAAEVSIGADLMPHISIYLKGLAYCWHKPSIPSIPEPVDMPEPDNSPAGTSVEHQLFMDKIEPIIQENINIPSSDFYTMPESIVYLNIPPSKVVYRRQYDLPNKVLPELQKQIDEWLQDGIIKFAPPGTPFNTAILCVPKKDSDGNLTKLRFCMDMRPLNLLLPDITHDNHELPLIRDIFHKMKNAAIFTTLDLKSCFHKFRIFEDHQNRTAFTFMNKQYCFIGSPFGIKFLSAHIQRCMQILFHDVPHVSIYVDDIIIASNDIAEHTHHVQETLRRLSSVNLTINHKKCAFAQRSVSLLGFNIQCGSISVDQKKISNVQEWPLPKDTTSLQRYLGYINYLRNHIPGVQLLTSKLDKLRTVKKLSEHWTDKHTTAFNNIKTALQSAPILSQYDESLPLYLATDASSTGIGSVLYQIVNNQYKYIGFMGRSLNKAERNYSTTKRELLSIVFALKRFHKFLWGQPKFTIYCDHKALTYLHTQPIANPMMVTWFDIICDYNFEVIHIPGIDNIIPDTISRLWTSQKLEGGNGHQQLIASAPYLGDHRSSHKNNHNRFLYVQRAATIRNDYTDFMTPPADERTDLLHQAHLHGHFGIDAIVNELHSQHIHWTSIKTDAQNIVSNCPDCQRFTLSKQGFHPMRSIYADKPWDHIALDTGDFNCTTPRGNNYVLVIVDIYSRYTLLRPIPDKTALTIAMTLIQVFADLGFPKIIQNDRGTEFVNEVVKHLLDNCGIDLRLLTPYNPKGNGVCETKVKAMKNIIIKRLHGKKDDWDLFLPAAQLSINNKIAKLHNSRPFALFFARQPNLWQDYRHLNATEANNTLHFNDKREENMSKIVIPAIRERMNAVQQAQQGKFSKKFRIIKEFPIGSKVMIQNINRRSKTDVRYEGPYTVHGKNRGNGQYVLTDATGALYSRDIPPHQIKLISQDTIASGDDFFGVQSIIDHKGTAGNYKYLVR